MNKLLEQIGETHVFELPEWEVQGRTLLFCINLNWSKPQAKGSFRKFFSNKSAPDLDLGCMFEMKDGSKGVIQSLGAYAGSESNPPFIYLKGDVKTSRNPEGETLVFTRPDLMDRILFFALIYDGAASFKEVGARMTFEKKGEETLLMELANSDSYSRFCAIALLDCQADRLILRKEERYFSGHREADRHYGFGFNWVEGSK